MRADDALFSYDDIALDTEDRQSVADAMPVRCERRPPSHQCVNRNRNSRVSAFIASPLIRDLHRCSRLRRGRERPEVSRKRFRFVVT